MSDQSGIAVAKRPLELRDLSDLHEKAQSGDVRALARLLTLLEREGPGCLAELPQLLNPKQFAFRVGITGPPGAGKSTLVGKLIAHFREQGKKVGVLAVDPSSPFTKGAVLGDRIRYHEHFGDPGVFIRSLGSRGSLGGLSASAYLMVRAFDAAKFDVLLLETVGVGQTELDVMNVADWLAVVLVPESGDAIQGMKAGLLEIADAFIVNKSDRPGADAFVRELEASLHLDPRAPAEPVPVLKTTATSGDGVAEVLATIDRAQSKTGPESWKVKRASLERLRSEAKALLRSGIEREIETRAGAIQDVAGFISVFRNAAK